MREIWREKEGEKGCVFCCCFYVIIVAACVCFPQPENTKEGRGNKGKTRGKERERKGMK